MTDCQSESMRDLLPELAHGRLSAAAAMELRAHLNGCGECAAEFAVLETTRLVLQANAPHIDLAAITAAVSAEVAPSRPALRVERGGAAPSVARRSVWRARQWLAAAASILVIVSVSLPLVNGTRGDGTPGATTDPVVSTVIDTPAATVSTAGLAVGEGLTDLSDDDLSTLLAELENVEATINAEPTTLRSPIVDTPEGY